MLGQWLAWYTITLGGVRRLMASQAWQLFHQLAAHSLDLAIYVWPLSLAVLLAAAIALFVGDPFRNPHLRSRFPLLLITYVFPVVILIVGIVLRYDGPPHPHWVEPPLWRGVVLGGVIIVHALTLAVAAVLMRGAQIRAAAIMLPGFWLSLSCGFVSAIAIGGVGL